MSKNEIESWSVDSAKQLYGIENWGAGYFNINQKGNVSITPQGENGPAIDFAKLVQEVETIDIEIPVLFRFNDILRHRVKTIYNAFDDAIKQGNYTGKYYPAYPIKVNQQKHIIDVIRKSSDEFTISLEVGSKPELIAVMGLKDSNDGFLLCNGYKDESYIELALSGQKIGRKPIIIIEKYTELELVFKVAKRLDLKPKIGLRLRLSGKGAGRWENSGGDRAKFGLTISEIQKAYEYLEANNHLDSLKLIHFHAGSQLTTISKLRVALKEASQVYIQLKRKCPDLDFLDVGGGLGVDYDGSKTNFSSSMNYTVEEYARDVIWVLQEACELAKVECPNIVTEAGRATVAHSSVLVFNVLGIANTFDEKLDADEVLNKSQNAQVRNLAYLFKDITPKNCQESLHDAIALRSDLISQFSMGLVSLEDRALGDRCYWASLSKVSKNKDSLSYIPEDLEKLPSILTDTYFCNFSVFQSMPDSWAIQQIFPIMPISRLNEKPERSVVLADITCDSDGEISRFPDLRDVKRYLNAHPLQKDTPYYFGAFLVGAYQEILGDLHNLFGDTNAIHVEVDKDGEFEFSDVVNGDSVREVLEYVEFSKEELCNNWRSALEKAVKKGEITSSQSGELFKKYAKSFESYTYLSV